MVRNNPNIHGIQIGDQTHKYDADDITILGTATTNTLQNLMVALKYGDIFNFKTSLNKLDFLNLTLTQQL